MTHNRVRAHVFALVYNPMADWPNALQRTDGDVKVVVDLQQG